MGWAPQLSIAMGQTASSNKMRWRFSPPKSCRIDDLGLLDGHEMGHHPYMVSAVRLGVGVRLSVDVGTDAAARIAVACRAIGDAWALEIADALSTALGASEDDQRPRTARPASGCYRLVARAR